MIFSTVHPNRRTPWIAIVFTSLVALALIITVGRNDEALSTLSSTTVVLLLSAFVVVNVSVLVLRRDPVDHEHFTTPNVFPILGIVVSGALLVYTAISDIKVFGLAALPIGVGAVLSAVHASPQRS